MNYQWRKIHFFDDTPQTYPLPDEIHGKVTCASGGRGFVALGSSDGSIFVLDRGFKVKIRISGHGGQVKRIQQLKRRNVIVTLGEEDTTSEDRLSSTTIKLWDLDKSASEGSPAALASLRLFSTKFPESKISSLCVLEEMPPVLVLAVGLESGHVYIIHGDISKDRVFRFNIAIDPAQEGTPASPVTGLGFRKDGDSVLLFAVTAKSVSAVPVDPKSTPVKQLLDEHGAEDGCSTMNSSQELLVGTPDAVYLYNDSGKGPCWVLSGKKRLIHWFNSSYLAVTYPDPKHPGTRQTLTIYDLLNKLTVGTVSVPQADFVVDQWGALVLISSQSGHATCLSERDMASKLEALFEKHMYSVAIHIASCQHQAEPGAVAEVVKRYGDHLYSIQKYEEAMSQYTSTIGQLEPSYVIQKFLDAQRIRHLTLYLEKLHEAGVANGDHTTLLINCYTKLKDGVKLDSLVNGGTGGISFDVPTALRVCRSAGYFDHARQLARSIGDHDSFVAISIEELGDSEGAIEYIRKLPAPESSSVVRRFGGPLLHTKPSDVTQIVLDLCLTAGEPLPAFFSVFVDYPACLEKLLEGFLERNVESPWLREANNNLLQLYLSGDVLSGKNKKLPDGPDPSRDVPFDKAMRLLKRAWPEFSPQPNLDADVAIVLCQMHGFKLGLLFLYDRMGLHREVVSWYMNENDFHGLILCCKRLGVLNPEGAPRLWSDALNFLAGCEAEFGDDVVAEVLSATETIFPPLMVLQTLAKNPRVTFGSVREFVCRKVAEHSESIEENQSAIQKYTEETNRMKEEMADLNSRARIFQLSKCCSCGYALDLPAVHFLCMHSFHLRCMGDSESECPICSPSDRTVFETRRDLERAADDHDAFFSMLKNSEDGFSIVADYFGRGILNNK